MHTIETELSKVTKLKQGKKQDRQEYLAALATAAGELEDDAFDKLSDAAQAWTNDAVTAVNSKSEIEDFDDGGGKPNGKAEQEPARRSGAKKAAKKAAAKAPAKQATKSAGKAASAKKAASKGSGKAPAKEASKRGSAEPSSGSMTYLKELLIKNINMSKEDLTAKMRAKGFKTSEVCIATWKSYFRHSIKVLKANGVDLKNFEV